MTPYQLTRIDAALKKFEEYQNNIDLIMTFEDQVKLILSAADAVPVPQDDALVERVAIAACCKHDNGDPFNWQFWHEDTKNRWREIARAAIAAMQPKAEG